MFESVEKDLLPNKIVNSLLALIKERQLLPGDRLPPERELAQMMNVGRPSLRAALRALALMNVIEIHPGAGTYVSSLEPERLVEHLDFVFALDDSSVLQLFDARRTLELRTAALAAQCITDAEIAQLEAILAEWAAAEDDEAREEADREFHKLIAISSRNPILARFVMIVNQLGTESRWRAYGLPTAIDKTMDEHRAIVDALRRHDPKAAEAAMLHHLEHAEVYLRQILLSEE
ncbi:MAG: FadR/GntR family transcriptional regulator [Caldilineaceae bacterium]